MREDLLMRYKKIVPISPNTNSERNLVLRQQFGLHLIKLLSEGKRIINFDETWLGMCDFRFMRWCHKDKTNSLQKKQL